MGTDDGNVQVTRDGGKTWNSLASENIEMYCHTIKQDLINPDLLFLGTEFGLYLSLDHGKQWKHFKNKVPNVGVYDIAIQPDMNDLILGTHGRGIIIIDDITPLRYLTAEKMSQNLAFLPLRPFHFISETGLQDFTGDQEFLGPNYANVPRIAYYLKKRHLFGQAAFGPSLEAGTYTLKLIKGKSTYETELVLNENPMLTHSKADRKLRHETLMRAYNMLENLAAVDEQILKMQAAAQAEFDSAKRKSVRKRAQTKIDKYAVMHESISAT